MTGCSVAEMFKVGDANPPASIKFDESVTILSLGAAGVQVRMPKLTALECAEMK